MVAERMSMIAVRLVAHELQPREVAGVVVDRRLVDEPLHGPPEAAVVLAEQLGLVAELRS
jgi:hypothetical protein